MHPACRICLRANPSPTCICRTSVPMGFPSSPTGVLTMTPFLMISLPTLIVANHCPKACETWSCNYRFATGKWQQKVMQVTQRHMICQQQHRRRTSTRLTRSLEESFETFRGLGAMISEIHIEEGERLKIQRASYESSRFSTCPRWCHVAAVISHCSGGRCQGDMTHKFAVSAASKGLLWDVGPRPRRR